MTEAINQMFIFPGKFIGSTSFWVYVLIGEFVVMLVCFDLILYCKQLGFLYKCTKKCRKERSLEVSDNQNKQTEQTDQTHIQGELLSLRCFYDLKAFHGLANNTIFILNHI